MSIITIAKLVTDDQRTYIDSLPGAGVHVVYSLYAPDRRDPDDPHLAYVGVTSNIRQRLRAHSRKWWWPLIDLDLAEFEIWPTRERADYEERRSILLDRPALNSRANLVELPRWDRR